MTQTLVTLLVRTSALDSQAELTAYLDCVPEEFLKLEDITHRFRRPCIMDVKLGRRVWDDYAEQDKIDREKKKYPAQEIIGFRIIGMRVRNGTGLGVWNVRMSF